MEMKFSKHELNAIKMACFISTHVDALKGSPLFSRITEVLEKIEKQETDF